MNIRQKLSTLNDHAILALILFIALIVRLLGILTRPIWYDEAFAVLFAEKGLAAMLKGTLARDASGAAAEEHPLAYYSILWGWMKIFGESLVSVRLLSILFGLGIVLAAYFLLRILFANPRLALLGALGVALSPFQAHYSQEIRMYALLALALTVATFALWQGLSTDQRRWWVLFAVCAALAEYTQNLAAFYLVPLALTPVLLRRWDKVKMTFLAGAGALLLYLPWLLQLPAQFAKIQNAYWVERPTLSNVFTTLLSYVTNLPIDDRWISLAMVVTLVVTVLAAYQTFLALKKRRPGARRGAWLAYLAFTPAMLMFLVSQWKPVYIDRALLPSGVIFWLWLAWALTAAGLPRFLRILNFGLLAAGITLGLVMHLTYAGFPYGPYAALDAALAQRSRFEAGDVIVHSNKLSVLPAIYYDRSLEQRFIADPPGSTTDTLAPATQQVLGIQASASLESATGGAKRIWFIIFQKSIDEATDAGLPTHPHITWLDGHFHRQNVETWGPLILYEYTP
jgi:4-amino-4-deoxy-L-arabinose transferase-like glycosyltransferase